MATAAAVVAARHGRRRRREGLRGVRVVGRSLETPPGDAGRSNDTWSLRACVDRRGPSCEGGMNVCFGSLEAGKQVIGGNIKPLFCLPLKLRSFSYLLFVF
ncbi:hypothetical protein E2C01_059748 [Portunus trituberculatus]|uniref:Uncharacterized protein n=1 Tax=Portunus trituberculatus TaxID=210409 RepID=A0A5B7H070_PORTR|nr:hypothetical protein [Portunus trituberculatus]